MCACHSISACRLADRLLLAKLLGNTRRMPLPMGFAGGTDYSIQRHPDTARHPSPSVASSANGAGR